MKKITNYLIISILLFSLSASVNAVVRQDLPMLEKAHDFYGDYIVQSIWKEDDGGHLKYDNDEVWVYRRQFSESHTFCVAHGYVTPAYDYSSDYKYRYYTRCKAAPNNFGNNAVAAAIGYAIDVWNNADAGQIPEEYYGTQLVIWKLLQNYSSGKNIKSDLNWRSDGVDYSYDWVYDNAVNEYNYYNRTSLSLDSNQLTFTKVDNNYVSNYINPTNAVIDVWDGINATEIPDDNITFSLKIGDSINNDYVKQDGNGYYVKIPVSDLNSTTNVELTLTAERWYRIATKKECVGYQDTGFNKNETKRNKQIQSVSDEELVYETKTISGSASGSIPVQTGNLYVRIKDENGLINDPSVMVTFNLYENSNCSGAYITNASAYLGDDGIPHPATFTGLLHGNYSLRVSMEQYIPTYNFDEHYVSKWGECIANPTIDKTDTYIDVLYEKPKDNLNVVINDSNGRITNSNVKVKFEVYNSSDCTGSKVKEGTTSGGSVSFSELLYGNYSVKVLSEAYDGGTFSNYYVSKKNTCVGNASLSGSSATVNVNYTEPTGNLNIVINDSNGKITNSNVRVQFAVYNGSNCTGSPVSTGTTSGGTAIFSNLLYGNYSVKVLSEAYDGGTFSHHYVTKTGSCVAQAALYSASTNVDVGYEFAPKGDLRVEIFADKVKISNPTVFVTFELYNGTDCSGQSIGSATTSAGTATFSNLLSGVYSLKVISEKIGTSTGNFAKTYMRDIESPCVVTKAEAIFGNGKKYHTEKVDYTKRGCTPDLNRLKEKNALSKESLIQLYNDYKAEDYKQLLDFRDNFANVKCAKSTCDSTNELGCLSGDLDMAKDFSKDNLSCADDVLYNSNGTPIAFCDNYVTLQNHLGGVSTFYGQSGEFLIKKVNNQYIYKDSYNNTKSISSNNGIFTAISAKRCYVVKSANPDLNPINFDANTIKLNGKSLSYETLPVKNNKSYADATFDFQEKQNVYKYDLGNVYLEEFTGFSASNSSILSGNTEKIPGIITSFEDTSGTIDFSITYGSNVSKKTYRPSEAKICKYDLNQNLITFDDKPKGELNLEFRVIDTTEPFTDRNTNKNWCSGNNCSSDNDVVTDIIKDSNNSFDKTGEGAKYKITLTPSDIKAIREYNRSNNYDNYSLYCNVSGCSNAFIYSLTQGKVNTYTKQNDTTYRIYETHGTLSNKLIKK